MTTEVLTPANYFPRMAELRGLGAVIPYWKVGKTNSEWVLQWYLPSTPQTEPQQGSLFDSDDARG